MSDDGVNGFTVIAFVGSVFSPYYKWARRKAPAEPENHCAINVALYGQKRRWAMTERGRNQLCRSADTFILGPSSMRWDGRTLLVDIAERCCPVPHEVRGQIAIEIPHPCQHVEALDHEANHYWGPIAPQARVAVSMERPRLSWQGTAYVDNNWGGIPLEDTFSSWIWARTPQKAGAQIVYDVEYRDGTHHAFALWSDIKGDMTHIDVPPLGTLPRTGWRIERPVRAAEDCILVSTLEDTPFYARSLLQLSGDHELTMHESLDLKRFASPMVQVLLPFRMPRRS